MKKIDLKNFASVLATGDIHGNFRAFVNCVTVQHSIRDAVVVVCGDIGMGFNKSGYYRDEFSWMQRHLEQSNVVVVMFRGNHDQPEWFCDPEYAEFQYGGNYPNVYLIEDYTILDTVQGKVLCIGGAISIDRSARAKNISWWENEKFTMPDELDYLEIESEQIDIVATHTCPSCCGPLFNDAMGYEKVDPFLMSELQNERLDLLEVCENLRQSNTLKLWVYGHFHGHFSDNGFGIHFVGLDMIRPNRGGSDLYEIKTVENV